MSRRHFNGDEEERRQGWFPTCLDVVGDFFSDDAFDILAGAARFIGHAVVATVHVVFHLLD